MAAPIRRTLSPVPRAGGLQSGEVCSVPSPLSKSSPCTQNYSASGGLLSSLFSSLDSKGLINGVLSHRSNKTLERSKYKGQLWRRAVWHFFICFLVGVFMGLTPIVSKNLSMSKNQAFTFEALSTAENVESNDEISSNDVPQVGGGDSNALSEHVKRNPDFLDDSVVVEPENQTVNGDSTVVLQKLLIVVTPTYTQPLQAYYLNRLAHTLKLVPSPLLWIVVEMTLQSGETADILRKTGLMYRHLVCVRNITDKEDRRVHQRNSALSHIGTHRLDGIVLFADVENIYSIDLFEQIRQIRRFGTWVVGRSTNFRGEAVVEGPVCNASQVIGWHTKISNTRYRRFHAEMPGFAFNSTILWDPKRWHRPTMEPVRQLDRVRESSKASTFIEQVVEDESQMEALQQDCSRIMVWRLQLKSSISSYPQNWFIKNNLHAKVPLL